MLTDFRVLGLIPAPLYYWCVLLVSSMLLVVQGDEETDDKPEHQEVRDDQQKDYRVEVTPRGLGAHGRGPDPRSYPGHRAPRTGITSHHLTPGEVRSGKRCGVWRRGEMWCVEEERCGVWRRGEMWCVEEERCGVWRRGEMWCVEER